MLPPLKERFKQLISLASVSSTQATLDQSNEPVIQLLANWLSSLKFDCTIQTVAHGKYNLLAKYGSGEGGLILSGHTDTVPYDESLWHSNPLMLHEANNCWYGLGSCDMKGFFATAIEALQPLLSSSFKKPLYILATCDEESSMNGARLLAQTNKPLADAVIIGEPTNLRPIRLHKGILMEKIELIGQSGHSSNPHLGHSALEAMHDVMTMLINQRNQWQQQYNNPLFTIPYPTLNLGCIHGGDNPNRICGQCQLAFDLRPLPGMEPAQLRHTLKQQLDTIAAQHHVSLNYHSLFEPIPAFEQTAHAPLIQLAEKLTGATSEAVAFATEAPFLQRLASEVVILGAGSIDQAHQPDEYVPLKQIPPYIQLLKQLINHYCLKQG